MIKKIVFPLLTLPLLWTLSSCQQKISLGAHIFIEGELSRQDDLANGVGILCADIHYMEYRGKSSKLKTRSSSCEKITIYDNKIEETLIFNVQGVADSYAVKKVDNITLQYEGDRHFYNYGGDIRKFSNDGDSEFYLALDFRPISVQPLEVSGYRVSYENPIVRCVTALTDAGHYNDNSRNFCKDHYDKDTVDCVVSLTKAGHYAQESRKYCTSIPQNKVPVVKERKRLKRRRPVAHPCRRAIYEPLPEERRRHHRVETDGNGQTSIEVEVEVEVELNDDCPEDEDNEDLPENP
ncbi:MAG: hypothetical protein OXB88_02855 [Bacteriovoracales bacterium]|nr:hypothetical protein [Bacteriovoracales bacterium]